MWIREARASDAGALARVFFEAVQSADAYTVAQRAAWAPTCPPASDWAARLDGLLTLVADQDGPKGFVSLRASDGYLDFAFVDPAHRGHGMLSSLLAVLENRCRAEGIKRLHTHASLHLEPILTAKGWQVLRPNAVDQNGQVLRNFEMEKHL